MVQAQCSRCNSPEAQWSRCNGVRRATALQGLLEGSWSPAKARPRNARPRSATAPAGQAIGFAKSKARGLCANHCGRSTRAVSDFPTASWLTSRGGPGGVRDDQTHDLDGTRRLETLLRKRDYTHVLTHTRTRKLTYANSGTQKQDVHSGTQAWFTLPGATPAAKSKQAGQEGADPVAGTCRNGSACYTNTTHSTRGT